MDKPKARKVPQNMSILVLLHCNIWSVHRDVTFKLWNASILTQTQKDLKSFQQSTFLSKLPKVLGRGEVGTFIFSHVRNMGIFKEPQTSSHKGKLLMWAVWKSLFSIFRWLDPERSIKNTLPFHPTVFTSWKIVCKILFKSPKHSSEKQYYQKKSTYFKIFFFLFY